MALELLRFGHAFRFGAGFFVQGLGEFLETGDNLGRFGQDGAGQFFGVIGPALRHFRERHHDGEGVVNGMFDLAEFLLQLGELFLRNAAGITHGRDDFRWRMGLVMLD
jgi:hypothetical protein